MTTSGDMGSAPMVRIGAEAPLKREKPLKKQGKKKMKTFKEYTDISEAKPSDSLQAIEHDFWTTADMLQKEVGKIDAKSAKYLRVGFDKIGDILDAMDEE